MKTPICDFVEAYCASHAMRLHMPGHKGHPRLGMESYDITEIEGADSLYEATGIIRESEEHAAKLFGTQATFYSAEGSSLCIRTMLFLACLYAGQTEKRRKILAGRNAHKTFVTAAGLLDLEVEWLVPNFGESYLTCAVDLGCLEARIQEEKPVAVYLTSPDYLGNMVDVPKVADVCKKYGTLLLVDNAHGAYLKFLEKSKHPMDLGADLCCDSAHKTLPVLTGGAYLHVAKDASKLFVQQAKDGMAVFGSTSPSYLILQSLDLANAYIADGFSRKLVDFIERVDRLKERLSAWGFCLVGQEPMKLTMATKPYGYQGEAFAKLLAKEGIVVEFADPDYVVMMLSCEMSTEDLKRLEEVLIHIERRTPIEEGVPEMGMPRKVLSIRDALFSERETVSAKDSEGRILAALNVGCPPAVPIVVCGEEIDAKAQKVFEYYGICQCDVVKK